MPKKPAQSAGIFRAFIALIVWFALGLQLYILIDNTPDNGMTPLQAVARFFIFFTILCNLFVAISLTSILLAPGSTTGRFFSKPSSLAAVALNICIVGIIYNTVLRNLAHLEGWQRVADELLHVAVPLLFVLYWLFFAPKHSIQWSDPFRWLVFPVVYLVYILIRGRIESFYPYPFVNVNILGYSGVALNSAGLMVAFMIIGLLFVFIAKSINCKTKIS